MVRLYRGGAYAAGGPRLGTEWPSAAWAWCSALARRRPEEHNAAGPARRAGGAIGLVEANDGADAG